MQGLKVNCVSFSELNWNDNINKVFCETPSLITQINDRIKTNKIETNLLKQIETSSLNTLVIVNLITEEEKVTCEQQQVRNIKISFQVPLKKLFNPEHVKQDKLDQAVKNICLQKLVKQSNQTALKKQENQNEDQIKQQKSFKNNQENNFGSWSIRIFPFHKTVDLFTMYLHQKIIALSQFDILSYQKSQKFCNYEYIFGLPGHEQKISPKLQTQIYLNWGQVQILFSVFDQQKIFNTIVLKSNEIAIVPALLSHKWKVLSNGQFDDKVGKMLTWKILPKSTFSSMIKNLQSEKANNISISYPIYQILIDYCFHEFALMHVQSQELMYTLANLLNREFQNELYVLQHILKLQQSQVLNGADDKKIDQCQNCGKFIVNYFGFLKNIVYCMQCVQKDTKIQNIFQKIPKLIFEEGCQLLTRIKSYKQDKHKDKQSVWKLMQNAVFFQYEDICDGDFVGSYNSVNCRFNETNQKKPRNSKQKIVQNTIKRLKNDLSIQNVVDVIKNYSTKVCKNNEEKKLYRKIMTRASYFMTKKQQTGLLAQMLPNYQQNNLKLFAIKLCVKDNQ